MVYKVIRYFTDLQDNDHPYNVGDTFPRDGLNVTAERAAELASRDNAQRTPLIVAVDTDDEKPKAKRKKKQSQE